LLGCGREPTANLATIIRCVSPLPARPCHTATSAGSGRSGRIRRSRMDSVSSSPGWMPAGRSEGIPGGFSQEPTASDGTQPAPVNRKSRTENKPDNYTLKPADIIRQKAEVKRQMQKARSENG